MSKLLEVSKLPGSEHRLIWDGKTKQYVLTDETDFSRTGVVSGIVKFDRIQAKGLLKAIAYLEEKIDE